MHLFYAPDIETTGMLPEEEAAHCLRVLRLQEGDEIMLTDGRGHFFRGAIAGTGKRDVQIDLLDRTDWQRSWACRLHLAVAPTKNMDRMEWLAEKATEVGLDEITFLACRFSERKAIKTERIRKILVSAMKQSQKALLPQVGEMQSFRDFMKADRPGRKLIAHCHEGQKTPIQQVLQKGDEACTLLIGPEGDFSPEEVQTALACGYEAVSLGASRLRTETAALTGITLLNLLNPAQNL